MKAKVFICVLMAALMVCMTACIGVHKPVSDPPDGGTESATGETESDGVKFGVFKRGIWWSMSSEGDSYYYFESDHNGIVVSQFDRTEMVFTYELDGDHFLLHSEYAEFPVSALIEALNENLVRLTWGDSEVVEVLTYQGDVTFSEFQFYDSEDLCMRAQSYFEEHNGYRPMYTEDSIDEGGNIVILLYKSWDDTSTAVDRYTVDRFTATGYDSKGGEVDLSHVPMG